MICLYFYDLESVKAVVEFQEFYRYAVLKLNKKKTDTLALQTTNCISNNMFGIKRIDSPSRLWGFSSQWIMKKCFN